MIAFINQTTAVCDKEWGKEGEREQKEDWGRTKGVKDITIPR